MMAKSTSVFKIFVADVKEHSLFYLSLIAHHTFRSYKLQTIPLTINDTQLP